MSSPTVDYDDPELIAQMVKQAEDQRKKRVETVQDIYDVMFKHILSKREVYLSGDYAKQKQHAAIIASNLTLAYFHSI